MTLHLGGPTELGDRRTAGDEPLWQFRGAELSVRRKEVWDLWLDIDVLDGLMRQLPADSTHRARLLHGLEQAADVVDHHGILAGARRARDILAGYLDSGCGRCVRLVARWCVPSPTSCHWPRSTPTSTSLVPAPSITPGYRTRRRKSSSASRTPLSAASGTRWAACGWSLTPTCPRGNRWCVSSPADCGGCVNTSGYARIACGYRTPSATPARCLRSPGWLA